MSRPRGAWRRPAALALLLASTGSATGQDPAAAFRKACSGCHEPALATAQRQTPAQWRAIVADMVARGAPGSEDEIAQVTRYLIQRHGVIQVNRLSATELGDALGLSGAQADALVQARTRANGFDDLDALLGHAPDQREVLLPFRGSLRFDR
ncbi:MAG: cytochrome c [Pseudomonas sp.]